VKDKLIKMTRLAALKCLALVCASTSISQAVGAQTLVSLYQKARSQDSQFLAAQAVLDAALEKRPQARAGVLPTVNLTANQSQQNGQTAFDNAPFIGRNVQSWGWTLQLTQPLLRWGNWIAREQADAQIAAAQAQFAAAQTELALRTAQAYFDVEVALQSVDVAQAQLDAVNEQLAVAQRGFNVGTGTVTDVHEAQAKQALGVAQRVTALNELAVKESELERIIGESLRLAPVGITDLPSAVTPRPLADWLNLAASDNATVRAQQALLFEAQHQVRKNTALHAPTLDLVANQAVNYTSGTLTSPADVATRVHSQQVGLQLTVPLYAGGATQSLVREASALEEKARQELAAAQRNAASLVRQAFAGVVNGRAQVEALQTAVQASRNAVESNKIGYKIGTRINPDVLNAEQQLYQTQRDLNKARFDTVMQQLKLIAAAGQLQESDLQSLQTVVTPTKAAHK
jgi:outer membrane protein